MATDKTCAFAKMDMSFTGMPVLDSTNKEDTCKNITEINPAALKKQITDHMT